MEHIDRLRFLSWGSEFVLTPAWTPFGRYVRFVGQTEGGEAALREHYVVTDAEAPDIEPEWRHSEADGEPMSVAWARARNDEEAERAWGQLRALRDAAQHVRPTAETERRVRFLESFLNLLLDWYARHGLPFPTGDPAEDETDLSEDSEHETADRSPLTGHAHAANAREHVAEATTMKDLWRRMNGGRDEGYHAFIRAVGRAGFYVQGAEIPDAEKYEAFKRRVVAYVDEGPWPM